MGEKVEYGFWEEGLFHELALDFVEGKRRKRSDFWLGGYQHKGRHFTNTDMKPFARVEE